MLNTAAYIWRNPELITRKPSEVTQAVRKAYSTVKAMEAYREHHRASGTYFCRYSGSIKNLHIHHIIPVSVAPELADDWSNFLILSAKYHLYVGHGGNWKNYVENVDDLCRVRNLVKTHRARQI